MPRLVRFKFTSERATTENGYKNLNSLTKKWPKIYIGDVDHKVYKISQVQSSQVQNSQSSELPSSELTSSEVPSSELPSSEVPSAEVPSSELPKFRTPKFRTPKVQKSRVQNLKSIKAPKPCCSGWYRALSLGQVSGVSKKRCYRFRKH
jgi:hypothetical protein